MPTERLAPHMLGTARDEPPHFAGRHGELTTLTRIHEKAVRTGKPPKGLVLVDGVQGVGKTQLLEHFVGTRAEAPARLALTTNGLGEKPELLFVLMLGAVGRETAARKLAGASDRITGVGAAGAQVRMDRSRSQWRLDSLLELSRRQGLWAGRTLLLTIDEVQNVTAAERDVLRTLHEGAHGCPIVVLCAGLQHAAGRLSGTLIGADGRPNKAGISRFAERLTLGPLRRHETKAAFALGLAKFGVDVDDHQAETLAQRAMDFPQHIHGYLRGVLDAVGGRQGQLGPAHIARAVEQGDKARVAYYQERLSGTERSDLMPGLAGAMRRSEATEMSWEDARRHLAGRGAEDADAVLTSALEHGVLTIDSVRRISFGMPSFHGFLLALEATAPRRTGA